MAEIKDTDAPEPADPRLDFTTFKELGQALKRLSARLNYVNRVAAGESAYLVQIARPLRATGQLTDLIDDPDTQSRFGDGYTPGSAARSDHRDLVLSLLRDHMRR